MNKEQELRLALNLASRNIDEAKKAYEFVIGDKEAKVENEVGNGVYLIYEDGHHEPFTGKNDKDGIKSVSIVFDGHSFAVALKDLPKKYALVSNIDECEEGDRKSTRLNSSHANISYAVFCLKKKTTNKNSLSDSND